LGLIGGKREHDKKTFRFLLEKRKLGKENQYGAGLITSLMLYAPLETKRSEKESLAKKTNMGSGLGAPLLVLHYGL